MTPPELRVIRASPGLTWRALGGSEVVGSITAFLRPDDRWFVMFDSCRDDAYLPLLKAVGTNTGGDLYTTAEEADTEGLERLITLGFAVNRREGIYLIPTDPGRTGLNGICLPDDVVAISAVDADTEDLRLLDDELRQDVPGNRGWAWHPADFHAETYDSGGFDPETYLVAADVTSGTYIGLARIWIGYGRPRLGLIAVRRPYRRRGVAVALLARTFGVLHSRGRAEVTAEVDEANTASHALLTRLGARRIDGTVEFIRRAPGTGLDAPCPAGP